MIKDKKRKILLLPGDGIGPEVVSEVKKIINWFNKKKSLDFQIEEDLVGGASYEKHKKPITDEVFYKALESEAVILGAVGGPKWDNLEFSKRPERALLKLRKELKLFANLRPAICFKQLVDSSSLKPEIVSGLDIMIVRELTGGIYFDEPRGIKPIENGERKGINTHTYTSSEIIRVAKVAFELAQKRNKKVTSCEKSNVMEAGVLWREEVQKVKDEDYPNIELVRLEKWFFNNKPGKLIEYGFGSGVNTCHMAKCGYSIEGMDATEGAVKTAKLKLTKNNILDNKVKLQSLESGSVKLPFEDGSFDLVISINTLHNLNKNEFKIAIKEINRVSKKNSFITVDAWTDEESKKRMIKWNLTALTYMHVDDWKFFFKENDYKGDYYWFMP